MPKRKEDEEAIEKLLSSWISKKVEQMVKKEVRKEIDKTKKSKDKPSDYAHIDFLRIEVFVSPTCPVCKQYMEKYEAELSQLDKTIKLDPAHFEYIKRYAMAEALAYSHIELYRELYENYLLFRGWELKGFPAFIIKVKLKDGTRKTKIIQGLNGNIVETVKRYLISLRRIYKGAKTVVKKESLSEKEKEEIKAKVLKSITSELKKKAKKI